MQFDSATYIVFLCAIFAAYWLLRGQHGLRIAVLLAASYVFYMWWSPRFILLIVASTLLDFWLGALIHRTAVPARRRLYLLLSIAGNLGVLAFFKYTNFVVESSAALHAWWQGEPGHFEPFHIILPVGISFYTFQSMSYTIDIYRGSLRPTRSFLEFALFVSFFPQLVAGPIVRARTFLPQLAQRPRFAPGRMTRGIYLIAFGLVKKVACADLLGLYIVDRVFAQPEKFGSIDNLLGAYAYSFQIYFDFSAYSDIAIGSALLLGLRLPVNFRHPFLAQNPSDLWRRWHISLSTWLRDYLYIPLGGNRRGAARTQLNLLATMLLGGLWHGAAWTFVFWGMLHGLYLLAHRWMAAWWGPGAGPRALPRWVKVAVMFHLTCLAFVFFRATSFHNAFEVLQGVVRGSSEQTLKNRDLWLGIFALITVLHLSSVRWYRRSEALWLRLPLALQAAVLVLLTGLLGSIAYGARPFIYFQF